MFDDIIGIPGAVAPGIAPLVLAYVRRVGEIAGAFRIGTGQMRNYVVFVDYLRLTVRVADLMILPWDALIVVVILRFPLVVVIAKVADELPERIVTVAGTLARYGWLLDKCTTMPPEGAGALSVTLPVEEAPPTTVDGLRVKDVSAADAGGNRVIVADFVTEL